MAYTFTVTPNPSVLIDYLMECEKDILAIESLLSAFTIPTTAAVGLRDRLVRRRSDKEALLDTIARL